MPAELDVTNFRFGRLVAIRKVTPRGMRSHWECRCDCGEICTVALSGLRSGSTCSCGCLRSELMAVRGPERARGYADKQRIHGHAPWAGKRSPTYSSWSAIKTRCTNPKATDYARYGGRGITLCERWRTFANFLADMSASPGPDYQVHRLDSQRGYEPGNCEWMHKSAHSTLTGKERAARGEYANRPRDPATGKFVSATR